MSGSNDSRVEAVWYGNSWLSWLLMPFSAVYFLAVAIRRWLYAHGFFETRTVTAPVIVVGNVTAGGTGKTPVTIWIARALKHKGFSPGIVSRGYGGSVGAEPVAVTPGSDPVQVGDEAVLMAVQCDCPVVVHPDRVAAAERAIALGADVIVSDDGLQHYRLGRNVELAVVDSARGFGNGRLLPAGPLREPPSRLSEVNAVLVHRHPGCDTSEMLAGVTDRQPLDFRLRIQAVVGICDAEVRHIDDFSGKTVHAVAGIGHPDRFFNMLESHGITVIRHPLRDHAVISREDVSFGDDLDVLMTQKDAVKCRGFGLTQSWFVPAHVEFDDGDADTLISLLMSELPTRKSPKP